jgi:hypothetical protein
MDSINSEVLSTEDNETGNSYVDETSVPLRTLYQLLVDIYDNAYPIPFIDFRRVFDRYMQATSNNLIDAVILLIYGAKDIKKIGTGTEEIPVERLQSGRESYGEDVKTVRSPFYRFIDMDDEIRIGYDYAEVMDFIDHSKDSTTETPADINDVVESDTAIKTHVFPRFPIYINSEAGLILFDYTDKFTITINVKDMKFVVRSKGERYSLTDVTEMSTQPVPIGCNAIRSVLINGSRIIVTELDNGTQFCYNAEHNRFEIIEPTGSVQWEYVVQKSV